jgi:hypothetical protein
MKPKLNENEDIVVETWTTEELLNYHDADEDKIVIKDG